MTAIEMQMLDGYREYMNGSPRPDGPPDRQAGWDLAYRERADFAKKPFALPTHAPKSRVDAIQVVADFLIETVGDLSWATTALLTSEIAFRRGQPKREWLLKSEQSLKWHTTILAANTADVELDTAKTPPNDFNVGRRLGWQSYAGSQSASVIAIDHEDWRDILSQVIPSDQIARQPAELLENAIILVPGGAHVYFVGPGEEGVWKHRDLPATLRRTGFVISPGSVIDDFVVEPLGRYQDTGYQQLARISLRPDDWPGFIGVTERLLEANPADPRARALFMQMGVQAGSRLEEPTNFRGNNVERAYDGLERGDHVALDANGVIRRAQPDELPAGRVARSPDDGDTSVVVDTFPAPEDP